MTFQASIEIRAGRPDIFALYAQVNTWHTWDPDVVSSSIDGAFASGSHGKLKPKQGPESRIVFTEVVPNTSFTVTSKLPLCTMRFAHVLQPSAGGTTATHAVSFSGLLAPLFARLIGRQIHENLPHTLAGLKRAAEARHDAGLFID